MGKKPVSVLKANGYSIYPCLLRKSSADQQGYRGVNIRAVRVFELPNGEKKTHSPEFELYDEKLVRIKATKLENGLITAGHSKAVMEKLNVRIKAIQVAVAKYFEKHKHIIKDDLMNELYGGDFA